MLLRVSEAADYLKMSKSFVYNLVQRGVIQGYRFGSSIRIHKDDLKAFMDQRRQELTQYPEHSIKQL